MNGLQGPSLVIRLHRAARFGDLETVKQLLETEKSTPPCKKFVIEHRDNSYGGFGFTALLQAAFGGHLEILKYLVLEHDADIYATDLLEQQSTAIHLAADQGHLETVRFLVNCCRDLVEIEDSHNNTPLMRAAAKGNLEIVKFFAEHFPETDLERRGSRGRTALLLACESKNVRVVKFLVERGAKIDVEDEDFEARTNAAHIAAFYNNLESFCYLLTKNPRFISSKTSTGDTLLHSAIAGGSLSVVSFLVNQLGFDLEGKGANGMTPLLFAAWQGELRITKILITKGANVFSQVNYGNSLHLALRRRHILLVEYLTFDFPCLITLPNQHGETPLDIAGASYRRKMLAMLAPATAS